ncbi:kinase-like domain-containing protein [Echria macrotheca]|uniref:Kinase-like domain-containing protein n=1 Tax=Echria macrotheca TaxID=438768 RepID=A0AAJ0F8C8_9PEZI|nr:kinase-like domain-containing protein [Echria macrotheca]
MSTGSGPQSQRRDSKFGLAGPITKLVDDRGEKDYREDFPLSVDTPSSTAVPLRELAEKLDDARAHSFHEYFAYIPRGDLDRIMSYQQVLTILTESPALQFEQDLKLFARRICCGTPPCRKLLAALVATQSENLFRTALADNMSDDCLPLKYRDGSKSMSLSCRIPGHKHCNFEHQLGRGRLGSLIWWSRALTTPYLKQSPTHHFHYVLEHGDHLPFKVEGQVMQHVETNAVEVVRSDDVDPDVYMAHGGFGKVFKIQIHRSHWNFGDIDTPPNRDEKDENWFALKQLNDNDADKFEMELKSLLYCQHHKFNDETLLQEGQKHMAHVRASIEIRNPINRKTDYYFLFDWQNGNLSQFWQNEGDLREKKEFLLWMSQQIFGLAAAVQCVHNDRIAHQSPGQQLNKDTVYGRHGDLSPSNILYSKGEKGMPELKLTDFGLAQLHSRVSRTFGNSKFTHRTETYGGPDFELPKGEISRATDIFSFGCVILEFITWYLLGYKAVEEFSDAREEDEPNRPGFTSDKYYSIVQDQGSPKLQKAVLKEQVLAHIIKLEQHEKCSWYLLDMLKLVRIKMLDTNPRNRISSQQLTKTLDSFRKTCEVDQSYYTKSWKTGKYSVPFTFGCPGLIAKSRSKGYVAPRDLKAFRVHSSPVELKYIRPIKRVCTVQTTSTS